MTKTLQKSALLEAITAANAVSGDNTASLISTPRDLTIKTNNQDNWISITIPADGEMEDIQVSAKTLLDVVSSIRADTISLSVKDNNLAVTAKNGGRRKIAGYILATPDAPAVGGPTFKFPIAKLQDCIAFVQANICDDSSKMGGALMGVHFHRHEGVYRAVSVSGNSCACIDIGSGEEDIEATVGKEALGLLKHMPEGEDVSATFGVTLVSFMWSSGSIVAKRVEGAFANYVRLVPTHDNKLHISASEITAGLRAIQNVAVNDKNIGSVRTMLTLGPRVGEGGEMLDGCDAAFIGQSQGKEGVEPLDSEWNGPECRIAFAARVMSNVLSGFAGDELEIGITPFASKDQAKPILIRAKGKDDRFAFMMPLLSA